MSCRQKPRKTIELYLANTLTEVIYQMGNRLLLSHSRTSSYPLRNCTLTIGRGQVLLTKQCFKERSTILSKTKIQLVLEWSQTIDKLLKY